MPKKIVIVVSDLHLGAGFADAGNALEDFTSDAAFARLVESVRRESEETLAEAEIVVNGDGFEYLQVPAVTDFDPRADYAPAHYEPSTSEASRQKTHLVIAGHAPVFLALRDFLKLEYPRRSVTVLKGNHDPHLYWPTVQGQIRDALGAVGRKAELLTFPDVFLARDLLYVEHGNQYTEVLNRFQNFARPLDPADPNRLETPPGSRFVVEFFNEVEEERYWIDSVKPIHALIWYSLRYDLPFALRALWMFLKAWPKLGLLTYTDEEKQLVRELADEPARRAVRAKYASDAAYRREFQNRVRRLWQRAEPTLAVRLAEGLSPREQAQQIMLQQDALLKAVAQAKAQEHGARVVLFGHTHRAHSAPLAAGAVYLNSGTWTWATDFAGKSDAEWADLFAHPEHYSHERALTYARIDYDALGQPTARLLEWEPGSHAPQPPLVMPTRSWWERFWRWVKWLVGRG